MYINLKTRTTQISIIPQNNQLLRALKLLLILQCCVFTAFTQSDTYAFRKQLVGVEDQWHSIALTDDVYPHIKASFSDLRVYGFNEQDTIEAAYFLRTQAAQEKLVPIAFKTLNQSTTDKASFFSFHLEEDQSINQIDLNFANKNYDWTIQLEASHNQKEWFTLLDNYRVLSIENELSTYSFTQLRFADAQYAFYRVKVNTEDEVKLNSAAVSYKQQTAGVYRNYVPKTIDIKEKASKTLIDIDFGQAIALERFYINIKDSFDYYRSVQLQYLADSIQQDNGEWQYFYKNISSSILSSIDQTPLKFQERIARQFRILIENHDNEALHIESINAQGVLHELIVRFNQTADYYLYYGNIYAKAPNYDIRYFKEKLPDTLLPVQLGKTEVLSTANETTEALFVNKTWLWAVMLVVMLMLGLMTVKMIKEK